MRNIRDFKDIGNTLNNKYIYIYICIYKDIAIIL